MSFGCSKDVAHTAAPSLDSTFCHPNDGACARGCKSLGLVPALTPAELEFASPEQLALTPRPDWSHPQDRREKNFGANMPVREGPVRQEPTATC